MKRAEVPRNVVLDEDDTSVIKTRVAGYNVELEAALLNAIVVDELCALQEIDAGVARATAVHAANAAAHDIEQLVVLLQRPKRAVIEPELAVRPEVTIGEVRHQCHNEHASNERNNTIRRRSRRSLHYCRGYPSVSSARCLLRDAALGSCIARSMGVRVVRLLAGELSLEHGRGHVHGPASLHAALQCCTPHHDRARGLTLGQSAVSPTPAPSAEQRAIQAAAAVILSPLRRARLLPRAPQRHGRSRLAA
mmetsp:Transcript_15234/g.59573  ORF Transcript_15234/g.59573 Transcript_15234/m.59573 type:complete len:250 (+) Transcript_15234:209-958(+)